MGVRFSRLTPEEYRAAEAELLAQALRCPACGQQAERVDHSLEGPSVWTHPGGAEHSLWPTLGYTFQPMRLTEDGWKRMDTS